MDGIGADSVDDNGVQPFHRGDAQTHRGVDRRFGGDVDEMGAGCGKVARPDLWRG